MSDQTIDTDEQTEPTEGENRTPKELREAFDRAKAEAEEGKAAQRELAFVKAGLDTDAPMVKFAMQNYDGELTADAVKEFASGLGINAAAPAAEPPAIPADEQASTRERQTLAAGDVPEVDFAQDPMAAIDAAYERYEQRKREGARAEEASLEVIGEIFAQAYSDPGSPFRWDQEKHQRAAQAFEAARATR